MKIPPSSISPTENGEGGRKMCVILHTRYKTENDHKGREGLLENTAVHVKRGCDPERRFSWFEAYREQKAGSQAFFIPHR